VSVLAAVGMLAAGFGLFSEAVAFGWDRPTRWLPDLAVGLVCVAGGLVAWSRHRGLGTLLALTGFAWFAGNLLPLALFWHRGPLVHAMLAYPGWRPRTRLGWVTVGLGYLAAATAAWRVDLVAVTLAVTVVTVVALDHAHRAGPARRYSRVALIASGILAAAVIAGAAARLVVPAGNAVVALLLAYEVAVIAVAVRLAVTPRPASGPEVTDLVIELGGTPSDALRDALARALGDRRLRVGYWSPEAGGYLDARGGPVPVPAPDAPVAGTSIDRDGEPFAIVVHDRAVLDDPALVAAVTAATRLNSSHASLRAEVRGLVVQEEASRRRLLIAGDEARRALERRLHDGPLRRLDRLHETFAATAGSRPGPHTQRAVAQLSGTLDELRDLARGLFPRVLAEGLATALAGLAGRTPVPVRLSVPDDRFPDDVEVTAWYVCAEAVANAVKHATPASIAIDVERRDGRLAIRVSDDGCGGADPAHGTGLRGLADRVEALGGRLVVESTAGRGTRLVAEVPLPIT
jgi:signal transduction histidine kinase